MRCGLEQKAKSILTAISPKQGSEGAPAAGFLREAAEAIVAGAYPRYPSFKMHLDDRVFYLLPTLMWLTLSVRYGAVTLPTVANPTMEVGGLWGESKAQGLRLFGPAGHVRLAPFIEVVCRGNEDDRDRAVRDRLEAAGISFPIVAKPDRGYQGWGVRVVRTPEELAAYLDAPPDGATVILQEMVEYDNEAGIFYIREPGEERGRIVSLTFVLPPHVIGDGRRTVAELAQADKVLRPNLDIYHSRKPESWGGVPSEGEFHELTNARSARLGAVYRDATHLVTPELERSIDEISREIPDFHFGRFDVRFGSAEELLAGEGFRIVELNGAGAEMLHIWDGATRLGAAYRTLWSQYRSLFAIGAQMRRRGHRPVGIRHMIRLQREQEMLRRGYPASM
jgi:hypothetical protein